MMDYELLRELIRLALASGGEYADVFHEQRAPLSVVFEDGRIEKVHAGQSRGVGIRVIFGGKTAFAISNDMSTASLREAARGLARAVAASTGAGAHREHELAFNLVRPAFDLPVEIAPGSVALERKGALVTEAEAVARGFGPVVRQVSVVYRDWTQHVQIATSEGALAEDTRVQSVGIVSVVAESGGVVQTAYEPVGGTVGFELFGREPLVDAARRAATRALALLRAPRAPGGRMPVVISAEAGGTMIHEAIGHGLEADLAGRGLSKFAGKLGQAVASPLVSVVDDATLPCRRGSYRFDDEGTPAQRTVLVERGVLTGYLYDRLSAITFEGGKPTGNGRRESYRHRPIPRMSNTFIEPGTDDPAAILRDTPHGLFVRKMGGGQVNTVSGEFVFDVLEGYLIEGGELGPLVRGATLTGSGPEILMRIDRVGTDLGFSIGTCGKDGQGAPVSDALPTLRIPEMVVGGEVRG